MSAVTPNLSEILSEVNRAVTDAENVGFQRGYAQAEADFYGQNAAFLLGNIFADAFEAAASRIGSHDARFAGALHQFAGQMRAAVQPPSVARVSPVDAAKNVAADAMLTIVFSEDMDPATITDASIHVQAAAGGPELGTDVAFDAKSRTATVVPHNGFTAGVEYAATVDPTVHSAAGVGMQSQCRWTFTVAA